MVPWNSAKAKVQLRLAVQRLRTLQEKKSAQAKAARRDIATLLERGRVETARIKVENIIHEDIYLELLEVLELYSEVLIARFGMLDQNTREPDPSVSEAVGAIIHASPRTELKELHVLRDLLMHKYGREFSAAVVENKDGCVSERVTKKMVTFTPPPALVDAYLTEIARAYRVEWTPVTPAPSAADMLIKDVQAQADASQVPAADGGDGVGDVSSGEKGASKMENAKASSTESKTVEEAVSPPAELSTPENELEALRRRFDALKKR